MLKRGAAKGEPHVDGGLRNKQHTTDNEQDRRHRKSTTRHTSFARRRNHYGYKPR
jgi:hypothetical protein